MCTRLLRNGAYLAVLMLLSFGPLGRLNAQTCFDCITDMIQGQHKLSVMAPPVAWHDEPCEKHLYFLDGMCLFTHDAGCGMQEEEVAELKDMDDEALLGMLEKYPNNLRVFPEYEVLQALDCAGHVIAWVPLRGSQMEVLSKE